MLRILLSLPRFACCHPPTDRCSGLPGEAELTVTTFLDNKQGSFKGVLSGITGQPPEWIDVTAVNASERELTGPGRGAPPPPPLRPPLRSQLAAQQALQAQPILVLSQVHAPEDQLGAVKTKMEAAVADGTLARQLRAIGLALVPGTGELVRVKVHFVFLVECGTS